MTEAPKLKSGRARSGEASSVRTLERGLGVLSALAELREATLTQVAKKAGLSASTTYRLLETLRQQGYVEWEERSGLFSVGLRAYQVGAAFSERNSLLSAAGAVMQALVEEVNETANLAVLRGNDTELAQYKHKTIGSVAGLGVGKGVGQVGKYGVRGFPAWLMHRGYHAYAMPTLERKARIFGGWAVGAVFGRDTSQLMDLETPRSAFADAAASRPAPKKEPKSA